MSHVTQQIALAVRIPPTLLARRSIKRLCQRMHTTFALQVAQAPKATTPQVQAISELELDQAWVPNQPARSTDINLSLLTSCLLPSAQVGRVVAASTCCMAA